MCKRAIVLLIILTHLFLLTGCWNYVEIDQQINVAGFGIDEGKNGKKYHFSVEVITADQKGNSSINSNVIEADGDTVFEAIRNIITLSSKKLYFGHCKTMVIGEKIAKYGIADDLDLPVRNHELRTTIDVVIARGCSAKELLSSDAVATSITSYRINDLLKSSEKALGKSPIFKTYLVYNSIQAEGVSTVIPALEIQNVGEKKVAKLCGVGVFKKDQLIGYLDELQTKHLSIMNDKMKTGLLTTKSADDSNSNMSFEIYKSKTKLKINFDENEISVDVDVKTSVNIGETEKAADYTDSTEIQKTKELLQRDIELDLEQLIKTAQQDIKCDIFGIGMLINKNYPKMWNKYQQNWEDTFPKIKFNVKSEVKIIGSGVSNMSA